MARLEVLRGVITGKNFELAQEVILGRHKECDIYLPDPRASRRHARISQLGTDFVLEDLGSANGTFLRGELIPSGEVYDLSHGDEIQIGTTLIEFYDTPVGATKEWVEEAETPGHTRTRASFKDVAITPHCETLSLHMLEDDDAPPSVIASLDAGANMTEVHEDEKSTNEGLHDALTRLQAICQVSTTLGTIIDQEELMQKITDCIFAIFPAAERSLILLCEKTSTTFRPVVARKRQGRQDPQEEVGISRTIVNVVLTQRHAILAVNAMSDDGGEQQSPRSNHTIQNMMYAPLLVGDDILGLIQVDSSNDGEHFTSQDLQVLTGISAQAAIAVQHLQLYTMIEAETAQRTTLQRYFSPKLVERLISSDVTTALGGNTYRGTILCSDIIGLTAMSATSPPADVMAALNQYFTLMQKLIYESGGNVDKCSGDGLLAFWGVPYPGTQDGRDAVLTALQMQKQLWFLNLAMESEGQHPIHTGIGLNTGEFIAGNVGSEDNIVFTLIGDHVNLATRIEQLASRYQVLVSQTTWEHIKDTVYAVQLPPIAVKGTSTPVTTYSIRGMQDPERGGYAMALPCSVLDANNGQVGHGLITGCRLRSGGLQLYVSINAEVERGQALTLQLATSEYHQPLVFSGLVQSHSTVTHSGTCTYTDTTLTSMRGKLLYDFFTPGRCLTTVYTWDDLSRS